MTPETIAEWERAADFYRQCKSDQKAVEVGAMRDAVEWLLEIAGRVEPSGLPLCPDCGMPILFRHHCPANK